MKIHNYSSGCDAFSEVIGISWKLINACIIVPTKHLLVFHMKITFHQSFQSQHKVVTDLSVAYPFKLFQKLATGNFLLSNWPI